MTFDGSVSGNTIGVNLPLSTVVMNESRGIMEQYSQVKTLDNFIYTTRIVLINILMNILWKRSNGSQINISIGKSDGCKYYNTLHLWKRQLIAVAYISICILHCVTKQNCFFSSRSKMFAHWCIWNDQYEMNMWNKYMNEYMAEWTCERIEINKWTNEWMNEQTNG